MLLAPSKWRFGGAIKRPASFEPDSGRPSKRILWRPPFRFQLKVRTLTSIYIRLHTPIVSSIFYFLNYEWSGRKPSQGKATIGGSTVPVQVLKLELEQPQHSGICPDEKSNSFRQFKTFQTNLVHRQLSWKIFMGCASRLIIYAKFMQRPKPEKSKSACQILCCARTSPVSRGSRGMKTWPPIGSSYLKLQQISMMRMRHNPLTVLRSHKNGTLRLWLVGFQILKITPRVECAGQLVDPNGRHNTHPKRGVSSRNNFDLPPFSAIIRTASD